MRLVLLGPPGAGKGTQAILLSKNFSIPHISTGEILRAQISSGSLLGKEAKSFLDAGELVPDEVINRVVIARVSETDCSRGFLLDGFPRTVQQAEVLDAHLKSTLTPINHVLQLTVAEGVLLDRIKKRGSELASSGSARTDDTAEVAAKRLQVYWAQTAPVADYYRRSGILREIDGIGTVAEVTERIIRSTSAGN